MPVERGQPGMQSMLQEKYRFAGGITANEETCQEGAMLKNTAIQGICCIQKSFNIFFIVLSYACWITNHP
jgi:hypothetical protein